MSWLNALLNKPPAGDIADNWRYADFCAATRALAGQLDGRNVALWFEDAACLASALLAAWQAGCRVCLPPNANEENRAWAASHDCLWLTDRHNFPENHLFYNGQCLKTPNAAPFALPDDACLFLKTSGSSGEAKVIRKTCAQMQAEARALADILPWRGIRAIASVSAQHLYGLTFRVFTALRCRWIIGREQWRYPEHLLATSQSPCLWITSPALLTRITEKSGWDTLKIQGILSAGGALPAATAARLHDSLGFYPTDIYGSTETGVIARRHGNAPWQLLPGVQVGLSEADTLWAQAPWTDGREQTADVADIAGDTFILQGRADRIIKFEDKRVSLTRLEHDLLDHAYVADAHCARHPEHGRIAAWVALGPQGIAALRGQGRAALIARLKNHLGNRQDAIALPRYWRFTRRLPRDSQAKIRHDDFITAFREPSVAPDWTLLREDGQEAVFQGIVPLELVWFAGHFAEFPLVPGVVEVQWAMALAARYPWGQGKPLRLENLKYQQFVRPGDRVCLTLRFDAGKNKLHFTLRQSDADGGQTCASGRMVFA